jgi:hypothetical protein
MREVLSLFTFAIGAFCFVVFMTVVKPDAAWSVGAVAWDSLQEETTLCFELRARAHFASAEKVSKFDLCGSARAIALQSVNAKGNVDANSPSKVECRSSKRFFTISRSVSDSSA